MNTGVLTTNAPGVYTVMTSNTTNTCTSSAQLTVGICVGIEENGIQNSFRVFPNPNKGLFSIHSENVLKDGLIEVYDLFGKRIVSQAINNREALIDIQTYSSGMYLLRISDNSKIYYIKVLKE